MRFAVFVFSLVLVVMPAYVHAIVFVPAITGALVRTAGGAVIKVANKKTLAGVAVSLGVPFAIDYCKKNKQKCKDAIGDVAEWFFDDETNQVCHYDGKQFASADDLCAYFFKKANSHNRQGYVFADRYKATNGMCLVYGGTNKYNGNAGASFNCTDKSQAISQHTQKIIQYAKDNDPDYIINNYGDTINIEQYCSAHACDELTAEFGDEVMKNKSKYDIDKINKANCEVENNKIKSCDKAKKQLELDFEAEAEQPKDDEDTDPTPKGDKTDDIDCDSSKFHKKICQFINWTQTDDDPPQDTKLDIDEPDTPKNKDTNINFVGTCPAPYVLEFVIDFGFIGSKDVSITLLDTPKLCNFLDTWVAPIMLFVGPLHAIYILGGGSREI
ncbi:hypothetical protein [Moraxella sp. VT-16-12]|nr:hypothetical protein [Moraxella sp. VT-16-12]TWV80174.1 hypothetical protein CEW93_010460 [Moraxella sp. VT-16-12]